MPLFKKRTAKTPETTQTDVPPVRAPAPVNPPTAKFGGPRRLSPQEADTGRLPATPSPGPVAPPILDVVPESEPTVMLRHSDPPAAPPEETPPLAEMPLVADGGTAREPAVQELPESAPPDEEDHTPLAFVIERDGANTGTAHCLRAETILGHSPNATINLASEAVNKRHASIRYRDGAFVFWDLASENYSFFVAPDGERSRILEPFRLTDGDTLDLADARLTFLEIKQ